jgi:glutamate dehydrogenase
VVNRLGIVISFELAEEEGASLAQVAAAYFAADALFDLEKIWVGIETAQIAEDWRLLLLEAAAASIRLHVADILRTAPADAKPGEIALWLAPGIGRLNDAVESLLRVEARAQADSLRTRISGPGVEPALIDRIVRLNELDGAVGTAVLAERLGVDEVSVTSAYVRLGEALGLDWAKAAAIRFTSSDPWERLLAAGLSRDFEQLRLDLLARLGGKDPGSKVEKWLRDEAPRVARFRRLIDRARASSAPSAAMLAQIAGQARTMLGRSAS